MKTHRLVQLFGKSVVEKDFPCTRRTSPRGYVSACPEERKSRSRAGQIKRDVYLPALNQIVVLQPTVQIDVAILLHQVTRSRPFESQVTVSHFGIANVSIAALAVVLRSRRSRRIVLFLYYGSGTFVGKQSQQTHDATPSGGGSLRLGLSMGMNLFHTRIARTTNNLNAATLRVITE